MKTQIIPSLLNVQRITWLMLIVLLSQQSVAALRIIVSNVGISITSTTASPTTISTAIDTMPTNGVCSGHHGHPPVSHSMQYCQESPMSVLPAVSMSDHSGEHGNHCENCVSGCQALVFLSINIPPVIDSLTNLPSSYHLFIPSAPSYSRYRPPITA